MSYTERQPNRSSRASLSRRIDTRSRISLGVILFLIALPFGAVLVLAVAATAYSPAFSLRETWIVILISCLLFWYFCKLGVLVFRGERNEYGGLFGPVALLVFAGIAAAIVFILLYAVRNDPPALPLLPVVFLSVAGVQSARRAVYLLRLGMEMRRAL